MVGSHSGGPAAAAAHRPPTRDYAEFVERTLPGMLAFARTLSACRADAEDAVQEGYLAAFTCWHRINGYESPEGWLRTIIAQRLWRLDRRRRREWRALAAMPVSAPAGPEQAAEAHAVLALLAALPPRQRMVMTLCVLHGMPQDAVAARLGVRRSTVAGHLHRARRTLETALEMQPTSRRSSHERFAPTAGPTGPRPDCGHPLSDLLLDMYWWVCGDVDAHPERTRRLGIRIMADLGGGRQSC